MTVSENVLGAFLRDRRMRLDPAVFGFQVGRRRTPGLRREEVAQRANISPTWYTWLEQGRGGAPSAHVLDRIAAGLMLTEPERDHLHILAFGHPPEARYREPEGISPRLQRVLDAMPFSPAILRTATWDVVAWNKAATVILTDYAKLPKDKRNILRLIFSDERVRAAQDDWRNVARYVVGAFRADAMRAGAGVEIQLLVDELSASSPEFKALWDDNEVTGMRDGIKRLHHPLLGAIELEFSTFAVEGRSDLNMLVYSPANEAVMERFQAVIGAAGR
ncbi:helix-turn-helix transcriptional regulator [Kaistia dalseonensis]|uniref:Transcriptional regulator with XRE-family HTH domain n=1 Tax=Kaistia dalseonensis TaxID=410840 RepID=A0ABU0HBM1_9HYPH|nr:helix-turn-helix transcriptional regulator [Kaistia dalseonensis]MCX5497078.1 helix-turn-helix transcriptional regulator [Kaistia dalseonensis]MDQ0439704.1 transcriptional regulator with XRE-family HTH domain [Kaistia dalseonensis]